MVNAVLNQPPEIDLPWPKQEVLPIEELDEDQVTALLIDSNPELSAMSFEIAAAQNRAELA
jgi:hypothetical protein